MDVLCSDKTGTLTEARITLAKSVDWRGNPAPQALDAAILNARFETGLKSPIDAAILAASNTATDSWRKIDEVPFDFERRRVCVLVESGDERHLIVKGAPDDVLALCDSCASGSERNGLDQSVTARLHATIQSLEQEGFRVLGVARRAVGKDCLSATPGPDRLVFLGILAFTDPPKPGTDHAIAALNALGVGLKIITGDGEQVTRHLCALLGQPVLGCLTGPEIAGLSDEALLARVEQVNLFCRMTPPQKSRILEALKRKGHVVGYLGDGINDAPSLHAADVGFSVESGVDVAKEAASMILLRKDLAVIADGVREGRRTYANILKYVMMGTSSNFGNMFSMAGGALLLPFLPLLPIQILFNNLLYDLSETAIPLDRVEEEALAKPRRWNIRFVRTFMMFLGPVSSLFDFITFGLLLWVFGSGEAAFHTGWFLESMATQILVIFIIRSAHPWSNRPHPLLVLSSFTGVLIAFALPYSPLGHWLGFVPLRAHVVAGLLAVTAAYLASMHLARRWFFARYPMF
jgi:Mg2+-importing ATPase